MCSALVPALSYLQAAAGQVAAITGASPDPGLCVSPPNVPTSVLKAPPQTGGSPCVALKATWPPLLSSLLQIELPPEDRSLFWSLPQPQCSGQILAARAGS